MSINMTSAEFRKLKGAPVLASRPQIRLPKREAMNKTEVAYLRVLQSEFPPQSGYEIKYEAISFRLGSGIYTPDFTVWRLGTILTPVLTLVVEVKGGFIKRDASLSKFKEARAAWPHLRFRFAQRRKTQWAIIE